jgi:Putative transposase
MTLSSAEFMRRFLLHVLPDGFQRIRRYLIYHIVITGLNSEN